MGVVQAGLSIRPVVQITPILERAHIKRPRQLGFGSKATDYPADF